MAPPRFVSALRLVLDRPGQDCPISWKNIDGTHCVCAEREFDPSLHLPCTKAREFGTFVRQMHNHNFKSVATRVWHHPLFRPGCPWLDGGIELRRRVQRRTESRA